VAGETILIVEDDKNISKLIRYNLEKAGFACETTITGEDALDILDSRSIDLVILDIMLPKMDGLETCKRIRQDKQLSSIPVVMLTAKGEEVDRVVGFELGADDYMVKPFSPRELILRIKAILGRGKPRETVQEILEVDRLKVDIPRCKVTVDKKEVKLTAMEFKLLVTLITKKGRVQSRDQLLDEVWNLDADVTTRTVDTHVKRLRQKLGSMGKLIETVRGYGYRIHEEEEEA
jgi:DNA-binding response OmpR family regulator